MPSLIVPAPESKYACSLPYRPWAYFGDLDGPMPLDAATRAAAELLAELGESVGLLARNGIVAGASWRRESAGGEHRSWRELDRALEVRARFGGRPWCEGDGRTLADAVAQCWDVCDVRRCHRSVTWLGDAIVDPLSGELLPLPRKLGMKKLLEILVLACQAGTGGVIMSRHEWAPVLGCCPRTVYNYVQPLVALGLVRCVRLRRQATNGRRGTELDRNMLRIGPVLERQAAIGRYARRNGVKIPGRCTRELAGRIEAQLDRRAARRAFDRSGATYRGERGLVESTRTGDRRTRIGRGGPVLPDPSKRQTLPHSPPLSGLAEPPPVGGSSDASPEECIRSADGSFIAGRSTAASAIAAPPTGCDRESAARDAAWDGDCEKRAELAQALEREDVPDPTLARLLATGNAPPGWWRDRFR